MANEYPTNQERKELIEQFQIIEESITDVIEGNDELKKEIERMKELIHYVPGSSLKK
ncbi:MAG: hypothetical protein WA775_13015 [Psychroserpens sp.]|uniref:hypothetical protein n=1 Tax=Psychroserpens sp. TaxID=2020870 RepID=UPI003CB93501